MDLATLTAQLRDLRDEALPRIEAAADLAALDELDLHYLGRKGGALSGLMRGIGSLPVDDRPRVGVVVNDVRVAVEGAIATARARASTRAALAARLAAEAVDVTTPGRPIARGALHPIVETIGRIAEIFGQFGFVTYEGPEVETDLTNFADAQHPARPPGARPLGHAVREPRRRAAANPHLARPDPGHAPGAAADPRPAARTVLPLRGDRRLARLASSSRSRA